MELLGELLQLAESFDKHGVEYTLRGGLARSLFGNLELPVTAEVEFFVLGPALCEAKIAAESAGFEIETGWSSHDDHRSYSAIRLIKISESDHLVLDLLLVDEVQNLGWLSRREASLAGRTIFVVSKEIADRPSDSLRQWINRSDSPISSEEAIRLSRGISTNMSSEAIDQRMNKVAQLFRFWKATRAARIAAGKPGPYDLPPKNIRPISK